MTEVPRDGSRRRHRVLIVGAGRRVQNNFLPALRCMTDEFEIVGIHARTAERLLPVAERWEVPAVLGLGGVDFSKVDVVAVSVPTLQNSIVMNALAAHAPRLILAIDTPIAWSKAELLAVVPAMRRFANVVVTEDYMNFPHFALVRKAVRNGLVGRPNGVTLYNSGFLYHGLALIRSFSEFRPAKRTQRQAVGTLSTNVTYSFVGGFKGCMVGPYRRNMTGITLEGTSGIISEFPTDKLLGSASGRTVYLLKPLWDGDLLTGYEIEGAGPDYRIDLPQFAAMRRMDFADKSDLNLLRGCGLMSVFRSIRDPADINNHYGPTNGLYDSFISRISERHDVPFDPFIWIGRDAMTLVNMDAKIRG
jgi:hypothetical protein